MSDENNDLPAGYSRTPDEHDIKLLQVKRSGVKKTIEWDDKWNDPDYEDDIERERKTRKRKQKPHDKRILGTMSVPRGDEKITRSEKALLKKIKRKE